MNGLSFINASVTRQGVEVLKSVSFDIAPGQLVALVGPNGAGKTTAVRALLGLQPLTSGCAKIGAVSSHSMKPRDRAMAVSYLPQIRQFAWPISVREAVALGRFAHGGPMGQLGGADATAVRDALSQCDLTGFADRSVASLSGGELARVHIARALAANAPALIADEPIAALDPRHAFEVLALLKARANSEAAVLVILHDLTLAAQFCDQVILLNQGQLVAQGKPQDVLTSQALADVYHVTAVWDGADLRILGKG
jgi:iron complex transport system ATP-binding protein